MSLIKNKRVSYHGYYLKDITGLLYKNIYIISKGRGLTKKRLTLIRSKSPDLKGYKEYVSVGVVSLSYILNHGE